MDIFGELQIQLKNYYLRFLNKAAEKKSSYGYAMKNHKMTNCATLSITAETEKKKELINEKLKKLVMKYINTPQKLTDYMKCSGLEVYNLKYAEKLLGYLSEEEGFLCPQKGFEAFIINLFTGLFEEKRLKIKFSTGPLFIFGQNGTEIYTIARALHKYYGYKNKLPGTDYKSQKLFKKIYNSKHKKDRPFHNRTLDEMYACKDAIKRDLESINFSIRLSTETAGAKCAFKKMNDEKSAQI